MSETPQDYEALLAQLPAEWPEALDGRIRQHLDGRPERLVVLDDDPTGTQTVHGLPVLTEWSVEALAEELARSPVFYVLTNSRALETAKAEALAREIGANLREAAAQTERAFTFASRSDSTLRGHYPAEVDALAEAVGGGFAGTVVVPFFLEGGRLTIGDTHYVKQGDTLLPAAQTEFARDRSFGYTHSDLKAYVEEKTGSRVRAADVASITLDDLRRGGPATVAAKLVALPDGATVVVNSASYRDQEVFVAGLLDAEAQGRRFVYRCAASFVRVRGGIAARPLLTAEEMNPQGDAGGLVVVGSYVGKSTDQLQHAIAEGHVSPVELTVEALLNPGTHDTEVELVLDAVNAKLGAGEDVLLYTSRALVSGSNQAENLGIGTTVSEALCRVVEGLAHRPRYLIAKGGITSSDVATKGLGVRRAMVLGQILPGVPVWQLGDEAKFPGMAYVVFPGNVGDMDSIARCIRLFREG